MTASNNLGEIARPPAGLVLKRDLLETALDLCVRKTRVNIKELADQPKTWAFDVNGRYENFKEGFYEIGNRELERGETFW